MARLIDADALHTGIALDVLKMVAKWISDAPTINDTELYAAENAYLEAEPVRHGRWEDRYGNKYDNHLYECSECKGKARYRLTVDELGKEIAEQALDDYCPHCGVKMDGGAGCGTA